MVLDLGPCSAEDALGWSKFARRILIEIRTAQVRDGLSTDQLDIWSRTLDSWSDEAERCLERGAAFRWLGDFEPEVAEYLLDGLHRCLQSSAVREMCTESEIERHRCFTLMVIRGFVDGLSTEGEGCRQYVDQVLSSLGPLRPD